jgi:hypothetical protein
MAPLAFTEDAAARRWLAGRAMRIPLVVLKFGSPVLTIAALAIIVRQPNLAAQPLDVLIALALPFAIPFLLAAIYPVVRWTPQAWTLDATGIHGRGRVRGDCPWSEIATWGMHEAEGLPGHSLLQFRRAPTWRHARASMMVPAAQRAAVDAWFVGAAHVPAQLSRRGVRRRVGHRPGRRGS